VAKARGSIATISAREEEESRISQSLGGLIALAEAYPDLKASANFLALHHSLDEIEEEILLARNRYNYSVRKFNTMVESFPSTLIAAWFGFTRKNFFSLELATQRELPDVDFSPVAAVAPLKNSRQGSQTTDS
jgi:LemA protein